MFSSPESEAWEVYWTTSFPLFFCVLQTVKFIKAGLMENGAMASRLAEDGVGASCRMKVMRAKQNPLWINEEWKTAHSAACSAELAAVVLTPASTVSNFDYLNIFMSLMNYFVFASETAFHTCSQRELWSTSKPITSHYVCPQSRSWHHAQEFTVI